MSHHQSAIWHQRARSVSYPAWNVRASQQTLREARGSLQVTAPQNCHWPVHPGRTCRLRIPHRCGFFTAGNFRTGPAREQDTDYTPTGLREKVHTWGWDRSHPSPHPGWEVDRAWLASDQTPQPVSMREVDSWCSGSHHPGWDDWLRSVGGRGWFTWSHSSWPHCTWARYPRHIPTGPCCEQVWDGLPKHTPPGTTSHTLTGTFQKPIRFAPLMTLPGVCLLPVENSFSTCNWLILYLSLESRVRSI